MVLTVNSIKSSLNYLQANPGKIPNSKKQTSTCFAKKQKNTPSSAPLKRKSDSIKQRTSQFRIYGLLRISMMKATATVPVPSRICTAMQRTNTSHRKITNLNPRITHLKTNCVKTLVKSYFCWTLVLLAKLLIQHSVCPTTHMYIELHNFLSCCSPLLQEHCSASPEYQH